MNTAYAALRRLCRFRIPENRNGMRITVTGEGPYKRKDGLTVLCESGKILVLSDEGRILAQGSLPGKAGYVIKEKENIFVVCENAVYRI